MNFCTASTGGTQAIKGVFPEIMSLGALSTRNAVVRWALPLMDQLERPELENGTRS